MKKTLNFLFVSVIFSIHLFSCSDTNNPESWSHFRGSCLNGISETDGAPVHWSETENISWKIPVNGLGWSSPVVWGDQIWLTTAGENGEYFSALCIDFDSGEVIKELELFHPDSVQYIHSTNSYATSTPCIEEGFVYLHYGTYGTACVDTKDFKTVWSRNDLNCEHMQGAASSLMLYKDLLIVHLEGTDVQDIYALNKFTGEIVWQVGTPDKVVYDAEPPVSRKSYQTPIIITVDGEDQLITNRALFAVSYNPETGEENWRIYYGEDSSVSMPVFYNGLVLVNSGWVISQGTPFFAQLFAVDPTGKGDVTNSKIVWKMTDHVPQISTPVVVDSLLFMVEERGNMTCLNPGNGQIYWTEKLSGNFNVSLVYAGGNIYFTSVKGATTVIKAKPVYEKVAENSLDGMFKATPAILRNAILMRSDKFLYKIEMPSE